MSALADRKEVNTGLSGSTPSRREPARRSLPRQSICQPEFNTLTLNDGRLLAYSLYGKADGFPVFYFHSIGSSRLECALFNDSASRLGIQLIAIDRPGIGRSEFKPSLQHANIADDVTALANHLCLKQFGLMSFSTGGIFALTTAYLNPTRISFQLSLGGIFGNLIQDRSKARSYTAQLINTVLPISVRVLTRLKHKLTANVPAANLVQLKELLNYTDRKLLSDPAFSSLLTSGMSESFRQGNQGVAQDAGLSFKDPGFHPGQIKVPVSIWQGCADNLTSRSANEFLAARIPSGTCHSVANRGHFFFVHCMDEIFTRTKFYTYTNKLAV